ncbi:MAG: hypothetical protein AABY32_05580 [Nanoarchaeota archaeon]
MGIKMSLFGTKVEEDSLKNLVRLIGEDYNSLINQYEKSQKDIITSEYFGKVLFDLSQEELNAKINLYAKSFYETTRDSDGSRKRYSYKHKINKIKSLEGTINYKNLFTNHIQ